jgi:hypothetical protein
MLPPSRHELGDAVLTRNSITVILGETNGCSWQIMEDDGIN